MYNIYIYIYLYIWIFFLFEAKLKLSYPVNKFIIITYWHISRQLKAVTSTFYDWSCKVYLHTIIDFEGISAQFKRQGKLLLTQALMFLNRQWMRYSTWFISSFDGTLLMISKLSYTDHHVHFECLFKKRLLKQYMLISIFGKEANQSGHCKTANLISIASVSLIGNLHVYTVAH